MKNLFKFGLFKIKSPVVTTYPKYKVTVQLDDWQTSYSVGTEVSYETKIKRLTLKVVLVRWELSIVVDF